MKQAAIYARVSTEKQEEQKTIESQIAELREICAKQGVHIVKEYIDNGWSGETLNRPALDQLRRDASIQLFERVYFYSNDRLSRKQYNQGLIVEELEKKGIEIFIKDQPVADTADGQLLFAMLGEIAQYEKTKILERTQRGRLFKAKRGIVVGGTPPFGYQYIKKTDNKDGYYEIDEEEAKIVNLIADLYLQYGSVRAVAKELTKRNIKPRKGQQWRTSTLHKILRDETYIGTSYYNKSYGVETNNGKKYRKRIKNGRRLRDKNEWIDIPVPSIIPKEKFLAVQSLLANKHKSFNRKYSYLLSGLIQCGNCGSTYSGELNHGHSYYRCNNRHKTFPLPKKCNAKMVATSRLDNVVWNAISGALRNPKILVSYILQTVKKIQEDEGTLNQEKQDLITKKENLKTKKSKILDLYANGDINKEQTREKLEEYDKEEAEIDSQIKDIESKLNEKATKPIEAQDIAYFCQLAANKIENLSFEEKHLILTHLIERIIFYSLEDRAKIIGRIPLLEDKNDKKVTLDEILADDYGTLSMSSRHYDRRQPQ